MTKEKIAIISNCNGALSVNLPDIHFNKEWPHKGTKILVDRELLEDFMYDPGCEYMFKTGLLYIEEMEVKKELGLEPDDAEKPTNIIVLSDADKKRYLTVLPTFDFKEKVKSLSIEQQKSLVDYAVENEILSFDKCQILKDLTDLDAIKMIQLNRD